MFRINFTRKIKYAFSIAEILIVLLIVGIMAGLFTASLNPDKMRSKYLYKAALNQIELVAKNIIATDGKNGFFKTELDEALEKTPSDYTKILCNLQPLEDAKKYFSDSDNNLDTSICTGNSAREDTYVCSTSKSPPISDRLWLLQKICKYSNVIGASCDKCNENELNEFETTDSTGTSHSGVIHFTNGVLVGEIQNFSAPEGEIVGAQPDSSPTDPLWTPCNKEPQPTYCYNDSNNDKIITIFSYALAGKGNEFTRLTVVLDGEENSEMWKFGQNAFYIDVYRNGEVHPGGFAADDSKLISYNVKKAGSSELLISGLSFNEARCFAGFSPALSDAGKIQSCIKTRNDNDSSDTKMYLDTEKTLFNCSINPVHTEIASCKYLNPGSLSDSSVVYTTPFSLTDFREATANAVCMVENGKGKLKNFANITEEHKSDCTNCWNTGDCYIEQAGS